MGEDLVKMKYIDIYNTYYTVNAWDFDNFTMV